jgi:arylsulfatase A-like enzyme
LEFPLLRRFRFIGCLVWLLAFLPYSARSAACFDPFADATASGGTSYSVGSFLFGQINGLGTTWFALTNTPAPPATGFPLIVATNLSYPGLPASSGNCIQIPPTVGVMGRLTLGFTTTTEAAYFSFLLKVTDLSAINTTGTQNNYFAGFGDTIGPQNATLLRAATRIYTRRAGTGFNLGVARNSNTTSQWVFDTTQRNTNDTLFIVGSYNYDNHTANLWINPLASSFGAAIAPVPTVTATGGADLNANGIRAFVLGCRTNGPPGCLVDDLRVGTTWAIVTGGPGVALEPASLTQNVGSTAVFSVLATGAPPLVYRWRKNNVSLNDGGNISGANTATLTISNLLQTHAGNYSVTITNSLGSVTSSLATLTVNDPAIVTQPCTQVLPAGATAMFRVVAAGTAPLSYQWLKEGSALVNGAKIAGANTATLTVSNISSSDIGSYAVSVTNGLGSTVLSSDAELFLAASPATARRPNIIFILCDDLGYGDLGVLFQNSRAAGLPREHTPSLDTLAGEGVQWRRHYCPAPICVSSRASLLLGVHQGHANVRDQQFDKALANNHTLASVLKRAGYATAAIGKWGLAGNDVGGTTPADWPAYPTKRGFDYFFGYVRHGDGHEHYPKEAVNSTKIKECYDGTNNITLSLDKCYTADLFTARAKKWITDQRAANTNQPFFLYLAFDTPHAPYELPTQAYPAGGGTAGGLQWLSTSGHMINTASGTVDSFFHPDYANATYDDDNNPVTAQVPWPEIFKRFATGVRRIDEAVGDLKKLLQDLAIDTNTLVVFTSDNGPTIEDYLSLTPRYVGNFFDNYGPLDGVKRDTLEGGIRMPSLVRWPGTVAAGATNQSPSQFHDWMPTFSELAGLPAPAHTDGVSLVPTLLNLGYQRPGTVYVEYFDTGSSTPDYPEFEPAHRARLRNQMQVIGLGGFQGVRYDIQSHTNDFEIYDVTSDLKQTTNLAANPSFAGLQQQMKDRVLQLRRPDSEAPRPYDNEFVPALGATLVTNGLLDCSVYEGVWPWVPDVATLASVATGRVAGLNLALRTRDTNYALAFNGFFHAPADGDYIFYLNTDAGAVFRIHGATVIDDGFDHASGELSASIRLKAGLHPLHLTYLHNSGSNTLSLQYSGPAISKQPVPLGAFAAATPICLEAASWYSNYFGNIPIDWNVDDDNDGLTRFAEYAFGGQPFTADSEVGRIATEIIGDHFQIHYHRRSACAGQLTCQLQFSSDLMNWAPLPGTEISVTPSPLPGFEEVAFRAQSVISAQSPFFTRLLVTPP